jgi:hypothetical protein
MSYCIKEKGSTAAYVNAYYRALYDDLEAKRTAYESLLFDIKGEYREFLLRLGSLKKFDKLDESYNRLFELHSDAMVKKDDWFTSQLKRDIFSVRQIMFPDGVYRDPNNFLVKFAMTESDSSEKFRYTKRSMESARRQLTKEPCYNCKKSTLSLESICCII